jgi:pimeloyl-ACP methyl ester carboxylesterase
MARVTAVPRFDNVVTLRDGRALAYAEWGDPAGRPVVLLHGGPGSRLLCPDEDATVAAAVRLVTIDRPGYGRSDPHSDLSLLTWAYDFAELHGLLGLPPCPIVGWSSGGPYALACAVRTPALVSSVGLAASVPPVEAMDDGWADERRLADMLRLDRGAGVDSLKRQYQGYADDPASIFASLDDPSDPDAGLFALSDVHEAMIRMVLEGARQGSAGAVADDSATLGPWGFSAADVTQDVGVWLGSENPELRPAADYFAATIPRATFVIYPGDGHWVPLPRWAEMLAWLH